jgi:non-structural maintenance of chromosomes element 1
MEEQLGRDYGHNNRAFLQAIMARGVLTFEDAQPILAAILNAGRPEEEDEVRPDQIDEDIFRDYLQAASAAASFFDYEIRTTVHQLTKQRVYALVNTTSDPQTQLATFYSPDELSFIKRVLDAMFDKFNTPRMEVMAITQMQAIKLARPPPPPQTQADDDDDEATQTTNKDKGLKHSEVEEVLANLVDGGWFEKSRHNFYSLTSRGLLELRPWLIETFNDPDAEADDWQRIKQCEACRELLTIGLRCANPDCTFRIHDICQDAFWRARGATTCPMCAKAWMGKNYVGERAVTQTEAYQKGRRRSGVGGSASSSRTSAVQAESDDEDE